MDWWLLQSSLFTNWIYGSPQTQPQTQTKVKDEDYDMPFVSTLAHPASVIPSKRKSIDPENSGGPSDASTAPKQEKIYLRFSRTRSLGPNAGLPRPPTPNPSVRHPRSFTPPPKPRRKAQNSGEFEVVVPSPSQKKKGKDRAFYPKISDLRGISEKDYPLKGPDAPWIQMVNRKKYPKQRDPVDRRIVSFGISSETPSQFPKLPSAGFLRLRLHQKTQQIQGPPVTLNVDDEKLSFLSSSFGFINDYVLLDGVERVDEGFNSGCNCESGQCSPSTCDCLFDEEDTDEKIKTYQLIDGKVVLRPSFLNRRSKIVECNALCSCKGKCWNTVIQAGRKIPLEIFHTGDRGFGLRSPSPIVAGQFIDRYLGEVITQKEADARESANQQGMSYLFILDWEKPQTLDDDDEPQAQTQAEDFFVVDGQKFGSPTRFMNHSCNPNCKIVTASTTHHGDDKLYDLAFFALRDIPAGTELTFDYNPVPLAAETFEPAKKNKGKKRKARKSKFGKRKRNAPKVDPDNSRYTGNDKAQAPIVVKCLCGEKNCRGELWLKGPKKQSGAQPAPQAVVGPSSQKKSSKKDSVAQPEGQAVAGPSSTFLPRIKIKGPKPPEPKPRSRRSSKGKERAT
ncbi:uncharacterized protein N7483_003682 [Penicillium malachiteum]|uniref:uncharacterized protein n=1 Tax=Penicillium malachiteum TaxID=1324776 RepID=UPI0025475E12|nr:uncharacterized protein N7483_003682 [Penicillium malachiteum]KAJ5729174.1 hypothetical protein N7483_003682 [Penicillium malachiteum]